VYHEEYTSDPGAAISGFIRPFDFGPTLEKLDKVSVLVVLPTPITSGCSPGYPRELHEGPLFP